MRARHALLALLLLPSMGLGRAGAHALGVDCKLVGDRIEVAAFYDDDTPARKARIRITDKASTLSVEGLTDDAGKWSLARPAPGRYEVRVDTDDGHHKTVALTVPGQAATPAPDEPPTRISDGPGREEFTRAPWPRLLIGLLVIAGGSGLFLLVSAFRKSRGRHG